MRVAGAGPVGGVVDDRAGVSGFRQHPGVGGFGRGIGLDDRDRAADRVAPVQHLDPFRGVGEAGDVIDDIVDILQIVRDDPDPPGPDGEAAVVLAGDADRLARPRRVARPDIRSEVSRPALLGRRQGVPGIGLGRVLGRVHPRGRSGWPAAARRS